MARCLLAGAAISDITPQEPQFLFGYPHVRRYSTGVHDPLLSSALFLSDVDRRVLLSANDVIFIGRETSERVRRRIEEQTGVPAANIMVTATHTHSGPITADMVSNELDEAVPKTDPPYVEHMENGIVDAAVRACLAARPAKVGLAFADGSGVGTHRHEVGGPSDPQVPVLAVQDTADGAFLAVLLVCSMHPTVLHEDSTLISGDFPAMARRWLQQHVVGASCPVLHHTGPCGNQSPRHVTVANTFAEATRLGEILGRSVAEAIASIDYTAEIAIDCGSAMVQLPVRRQPSLPEAQAALERAHERLETLRRSGAARTEVRTAECDWFGAEESLALSRAAADGRLDRAVAAVMPAEVTVVRIGPWALAGWPGEAFVEFSLLVKARCPNCFVISLTNGELQGYLATEQAVREGWYEAMNSLFSSPEAGMRLVDTTLKLLGRAAPA
jgi:hypothetical protein